MSFRAQIRVAEGAVRAQAGHHAWGAYSQDLLSRGLAKAREGRFSLGKISNSHGVRIRSLTEGVDMGDHPPITPVRAASESQLGDAYRLYAALLQI